MFYCISGLFRAFLGVIHYVTKPGQTLTMGILRVAGVCDGVSDIVIILLRAFSFDYCSFQQGLVNG